MSEVFFETLGLPKPKYNLGVGSGSHGVQLAKMMIALEEVLAAEAPNIVLLYGDTNSTMAGALIGDRMKIPLAHVEAGLRSFNRNMPEECNRIITDRLSALLFAPTHTAVLNLAREGISEGVYEVGDVMKEAALLNCTIAEAQSAVLERLGVTRESYSLATIHRAENTDDPVRFRSIVDALFDIGKEETVIWPVHPRTRKQLSSFVGIHERGQRLILSDPVPYRDMLMLEKFARTIMTDSGGVQKEAMWLGVPCITLREETEWIETIAAGRNQLAGYRTEDIKMAFKAALLKPKLPIETLNHGDSPSASIVHHLASFATTRKNRTEQGASS